MDQELWKIHHLGKNILCWALGKDFYCYFLSWRKVTYVADRYCGIENGSLNIILKKGLPKFKITELLHCLIRSAFPHLRRLYDIRRIITSFLHHIFLTHSSLQLKYSWTNKLYKCFYTPVVTYMTQITNKSCHTNSKNSLFLNA